MYLCLPEYTKLTLLTYSLYIFHARPIGYNVVNTMLSITGFKKNIQIYVIVEMN